MRRVLAITLFASLTLALPCARSAYGAPIIQLQSEGTNASGQFFAEFLIQDPAGLDEILISTVSNLTISPLQPGSNFFFGSTNPVLLTATTINQTQLGFLGIEATNVAGATTVFEATLDPVNDNVTTSVPEPATILLLGTALIVVRRRVGPPKTMRCGLGTPAPAPRLQSSEPAGELNHHYSSTRRSISGPR